MAEGNDENVLYGGKKPDIQMYERARVSAPNAMTANDVGGGERRMSSKRKGNIKGFTASSVPSSASRNNVVSGGNFHDCQPAI